MGTVVSSHLGMSACALNVFAPIVVGGISGLSLAGRGGDGRTAPKSARSGDSARTSGP